MNGHGGNYVLGNVVQEASARGERMALFPTEVDWLDGTRRRRRGDRPGHRHARRRAGDFTSAARTPVAVPADYATKDERADEREHFLTLGLAPYTKSGVVGHPSLATAAKGEGALAHLVTAFAGVLAALDR